MPELADLIETILEQQLREEEQLQSLETQAANTRASIANAQEEIAQLLAALEIAVKRGMADPIDPDAIRARLVHKLQEDSQEPQSPPLDFSRLVPHAGESPDGEEGGQEEEEEDEEPAPSTHRSSKLIDLVYKIIQGFEIGREFTTTGIRRELAEQYPRKFASINPASISGTVARLYYHYDAGIERLGEYGDGIHYRRKATKKEETEMIPTAPP